MKIKLTLFLLVTCILTSCTQSSLTLYTETINESWYASAHVGTPTPPFELPPTGQKLIVHWAIPMSQWQGNEKLSIQIQFHDFSEETLVLNLRKPYGYYAYPLLGETFEKTKGFLSFKAEIKNETCIIAKWKHQLWTDKIKM